MPWNFPPGPLVTSTEVTFRLPDPGPEVERVALFQEVVWPREGPSLERTEGGFEVVLSRPLVNRMEYLFQLHLGSGGSKLATDPGNPLRASGPFGDKSVIEFPEYRPPEWTRMAVFPSGRIEDFEIPCPSLDSPMPARLWSAPGSDPLEELPLLIALDGLEYDRYSSLTQLLDYEVALGRLPPMRAALLHPVQRDRDYSASESFTRSLALEVLPHLGSLVAIPRAPRWRVGMGASLGGVAVLFAQWTMPCLFGGLFLQSASVFNHHYFSADLRFDHMERICNFTESLLSAKSAARPVPAVLTCGGVEETLLANTAIAAGLGRLGYRASLDRLPDGHNWVAWRDAFAPHLIGLLQSCWG